MVHPNARYRPAGVKAWWSANGNPNDWTGNHHAEAYSHLAGLPFAYGEGVAGQSFSFRGLGMGQVFGIPVINEAVLLPQSAFPTLGRRGPFSLEMWFRATKPGGLLGQSFQAVLGNNYTLPMLYIDTEGHLRTQIGWASAQSQVVSPGIVLDNTWHHVVGTLDAAGLMQVFLDGILIGTQSGIGPVRENAQAQFYLGHALAHAWPLSGDFATGVTFTGQIDEAATWSRVLTQEEILGLLACGPNGKATRTITPGGTLPAILRNTAYTQALTVTDQTSPHFTLRSGSLPPGILFTTTGSVNPPVNGLYGTPTAAGSHTFILQNIPPAGPLATTQLVDEQFTLDVDPSAAYGQWANQNGGLHGTARLPTAAPLGDADNLLKFAFNLPATEYDPRDLAPNTGTAGLPRLTLDPTGHLIIEFIRRRAATNPGITYQVETGATTAPLSPLSLSGAVITPVDATWERVTVIDPATTPRRFGRVTITQN